MSNYIKKIIKYFLNAKLSFELPPKSDIIIYDRHKSKLISNSLNTKKKIDVLDVRGEKFHIILLLYNLFNLKFSLKSYLETYINFAKPNFVITLRDNDEGFFKLKLKNTKKILIQQSWKTKYDDAFLKNLYLKRHQDKYKVDYIFCFNEHIKKKYNQIIEGNFFLLGSLKSNNLIKSKKNKKEIDISYISGGDGNKLKLTHPKLCKVTEKILHYLLIFSKKNKRKLFVYGKSKFYNDEKKYYDEKLGKKNYTFIPNYKIDPIKLSDNSNIVITFNSTLGYESLSRENKTIFLNFRQHLHCKSLKFGWPKNFLNEGPFWTSKIDIISICKLIYEVSKMNDLKWKLIVKKYVPDLIARDLNNSQLKKIINSVD